MLGHATLCYDADFGNVDLLPPIKHSIGALNLTSPSCGVVNGLLKFIKVLLKVSAGIILGSFFSTFRILYTHHALYAEVDHFQRKLYIVKPWSHECFCS